MLKVTWVDARADAGEQGAFGPGPDRFGGLAMCEDVGWLVEHNAREVILATSRCVKDDDFRGSNTIPKGWIEDLVVLQPVEG